MTETEVEEQGRRLPTVAVVVVALVIAGAVAAFFVFRYQPVRSIDYTESEGGRVLGVGADACKGDARARAEETDDAVTIHASAERQWFGGQTLCEVDSLQVELDQPLGDRTVFDAFTGEPLPEATAP